MVWNVINFIGWGTWANTLVLSTKLKRPTTFEVFYIDYCLTFIFMTWLFALTLGQVNVNGDSRTFLKDDFMTNTTEWGMAIGVNMAGGATWNFGNILLCCKCK